MKSRSLESVYWPGITGDITKTREDCQACHKMAKSNPTQPPYTPPEPEYPFQYLAADYFHHLNNDYCVVVDRYSHWPVVFRAEEGAKGLIKCLRQMLSTFGICEEIAQMERQFSQEGTQNYFWKIGVSGTGCLLWRSHTATAGLNSQ